MESLSTRTDTLIIRSLMTAVHLWSAVGIRETQQCCCATESAASAVWRLKWLNEKCFRFMCTDTKPLWHFGTRQAILICPHHWRQKCKFLENFTVICTKQWVLCWWPVGCELQYYKVFRCRRRWICHCCLNMLALRLTISFILVDWASCCLLNGESIQWWTAVPGFRSLAYNMHRKTTKWWLHSLHKCKTFTLSYLWHTFW